MGGRSEERDISLKTGRGILNALDPARYDAYALDTVAELKEDGAEVAPGGGGDTASVSTPPVFVAPQRSLLEVMGRPAERPDVVFIALHGKYGEDGTVQGMLELLGVPYTGSGVLASALAMNKAMSKRLFAAEDIPTPPFVALDDPEKAPFVGNYFALPLVVKPNQQGSSFGMTIVQHKSELKAAVAKALEFDREALIEKFIPGREITAAVLGGKDPQVLPLIEIAPKRNFYDFEAKYTPGATEFHIPARITAEERRAAEEIALKAHRALGCAGVSRVDMMVADDGIWALEVNTIPGMTATSLVPKAAAAAGLPYAQLCDRLIQLALEDR